MICAIPISSSVTSSSPRQGQDCRGCVGIGAPTISVPTARLNHWVVLHHTVPRPALRAERLHDLAARRPSRPCRRRLEYNRGGQLVWSNDPATLMLFSPDQVRTYNQAPSTTPSLRIPLPASFKTLNDILQLPLQSVTIGIGDPRLARPMEAWFVPGVQSGSTFRTPGG